jgi:hypothetical protein
MRFLQRSRRRLFYSRGFPDERDNRSNAVEEKLYLQSFLLGKDLRKSLRIRTQEQALEALELIYKVIGIDFRVSPTADSKLGKPAREENVANEFFISGCFFSTYYSADVCRLISSLDRGLAAG